MARKTSFYYSFLVLPPDERRAITAVWDFCHAVDDAVDEAGAPATGSPTGSEAVTFWRAELARCYNGTSPNTVQGLALQPFIRPFDLPRDAFELVIDGVEMDLVKTRYQTFEELCEYCRRVASAVGLICIKVFGCEGDVAREYAVNLGIALQVTNILRDVREDFERGRVYLPLMDLDACSCSLDDLKAGVSNEAVRRVVRFECERAHHFYQRAVELLPRGQRRRLIAAEIMRAVYFETLRRIERHNYDVLSTRIRVPRPIQAAIALREWLTR